LYAWIASATCSSDSNPSRLFVMKSPMRSMPSRSMRGATSTSTSARARGGGGVSAIAVSEEMPPNDAPTRTGGRSNVRATSRMSSAKASSP
jgi:hypothetical protein